MYLAQIDSVFEDQGGQWVDCVWLERAKDVKTWVGTKVWRGCHALPKEASPTLTVNTNAIQSIEGAATGDDRGGAQGEREEAREGRRVGGVFRVSKGAGGGAGGEEGQVGRGGGHFADVEFVKGKGFRASAAPAEAGEEGETVRDEDSTRTSARRWKRRERGRSARVCEDHADS